MFLKGIATSSGIAIGKVYKLEQPTIVISEEKRDTDAELKVFEDALTKTISDIEQIKERASATLAPEELAIFDAHLMMVQDPEYKDQIVNMIKDGSNADQATKTVSDMMVGMFESMDDAYFKERAADIKDVSFRLLCNILGLTIPDLTAIDEEVVIVAEEMTPSDTAQLNKKYSLGFVTEIGGKTSHAAIMAVALGLPAVVGCTGIMSSCKHGDKIILDAKEGDVIINPTDEQLKEYEEKRVRFLEEKAALQVLLDKPSITVDGHQVELVANIGSPKDMDNVIANGAEGVGLYRTEFLYMESTEDFPSEEDQFKAYKVVLERAEGKRVVVRTLDIGGDKKLPYFEFEPEMNPFLGYRAIRLCLDRKDIFKTQVRALLRASVYGKLAIMFPMIATIDEFKSAKQFVLDTKEELKAEGVAVSDSIEIGMMVEIPASAVLADEFAKYADFFSIGTNDLIQYSMAADRMSEKVAYLYQPLNPSILRLIKMTIDGAHSQGRWCGMCGEMGGDPMAAPVLLGLGLDEFSMSASKILPTRKIITSLNKKEMEELANKALKCHTEPEVSELVKAVLKG
ncbi:MAG: phosphoenolpyruvate--protein phosphotransferase [Erysipelotrichaceae bacterium]|nr:phosphoenolpyruvate--protein phosphotransferase [Erysipelotrichaceae bacterium]MBQ1625314.1 phosphoenolpyruvate--protein phosphotransferase [Erysipelotrichaceae bacterium]MBQ1692391.1 phosphoenolpyruvate--protein phosphotransferase [Erysipelotrichaceae bacterium]MBQ2506706.1 phosphoenolpyruvate--protein phosphotransferase [Erysipelotrichaceae bacterium]MBQ3963620.1 phosphoenolpyruvate--protein phosphotransferase [Erysipelotrichaceae bacterium]